jgi:hypothetical protein
MRSEDEAMNENEPEAAAVTATDAAEVVEEIAEDVREDIRLGHVEDDVSHVLKERLGEVGLQVSPDVVDDLAEEIENDASL